MVMPDAHGVAAALSLDAASMRAASPGEVLSLLVGHAAVPAETRQALRRFQSLAADVDQLFVVKFSADWCGPCRQIAPIFRQMAMQISPVALFAHVDVDENEATAARFGVKSLPTLLFLRSGSGSGGNNSSPSDVVGKIEGGGEGWPKAFYEKAILEGDVTI